MKLRYIGQSFLVGLTNGKIYECLGIEYGWFRVIDDSGEDYLYYIKGPAPIDEDIPPGKWEVVEDTEDGLLERVINGKWDRIPEVVHFPKLQLQYHGKSFGTPGLTDKKIYIRLGFGDDCSEVRIIDNSGEAHRYSSSDPGASDGGSDTGKWKVIKDLECGFLKEVIGDI